MDDLKIIARQYLDSIACCDFQKLDLLMHEKFNYTTSEGKIGIGTDLRFDTAVATLNAFPDLSYDLINSYQSGNTVITEFIIKGTRKDEVTGIIPSDRTIAIPACSIVEIEDGLIVSEREYYDKSAFLIHVEQ